MTDPGGHTKIWDLGLAPGGETPLFNYGFPTRRFNLRSLGTADPYIITLDPDEPYADVPFMSEADRRVMSGPWGVPHHPSDHDFLELILEPAVPPPAEILGRIERLRERLDLRIEDVAKLLGISARRYHEWRHGSLMPPRRAESLLRTETVLNTLLASEPDTVKTLVRDRLDDATALIQSERYASLGQLLAEVRAARARDLAALAPTSPPQFPTGIDARTLSVVSQGEDVRALLALYESVAPWTHATSEEWRLDGILTLDAALESIDAGDPAGEQFAFMALLDEEHLHDFRARALALIRDPEATIASWEAFLDQEDERAFDLGGFEPRGSIEEGSFGLGTGARPQFGIRDLGIDPATGRVNPSD